MARAKKEEKREIIRGLAREVIYKFYAREHNCTLAQAKKRLDREYREWKQEKHSAE